MMLTSFRCRFLESLDSPQRFAKLAFNISAPHMYAVCLDKLNIEPGNAVLDIGSGCGLLTCVRPQILDFIFKSFT